MTEVNTQLPTSLQHYSLRSLNNLGISSKDELRTCCNITCYQIRRVNNKGAILVLILSYLVISTLYLQSDTLQCLDDVASYDCSHSEFSCRTTG